MNWDKVIYPAIGLAYWGGLYYGRVGVLVAFTQGLGYFWAIRRKGKRQ